MIRTFRVFIPTSVLVLLLAETLLVACCYVIACYILLPTGADVYLLYENGITNILIVAASILLGLYFQDMYTQFRIRSRTVLLQQLLLSIGIAFLLQSTLNYVSPGTLLPRQVMLLGSLLTVMAVGIFRWFYVTFVVPNLGVQRLLFVGRNQTVQALLRRIEEHPELGFQVAGLLDDQPPEDPSTYPSSGTIQDLVAVANDLKPDRIVIGLTERRQRLPVYDLLDLRFRGILVQDAGQVYEAAKGRVSLSELRPSDLVFSQELGAGRTFALFQTMYSWVLALIGMVLTLPLMILVAIAVKLTSKGPALYRQTRAGLYGEPFTVYKFRSMRVDAEVATGAVWATKDDPRITPIGKWLRKLRLDELPQFFNVLRGEMNLVGPRPERPEFVRTLKEQIPFYQRRLFVKPGLTGWAQINHKYGDTLEDTVAKLEYDLYYIKNLSAALDFYIMFQTVKVMLLSRGAQ